MDVAGLSEQQTTGTLGENEKEMLHLAAACTAHSECRDQKHVVSSVERLLSIRGRCELCKCAIIPSRFKLAIENMVC